MRPLSPELRLFSTPWHWFVHGLGLGQNRTGFDPERATRIRTLGRAVLLRHGGGFQAFVAELLEIILTACDPADGGDRSSRVCARIGERIAALSDARDRARASAAAVESLVKLGRLSSRDGELRRQLTLALDQVAALPPLDDRVRYDNLHLLGNLLLAAARAGWTDLLGPRYRDAGARLLVPLDDVFYHGRGAASWQLVLAVIDRREREDAGQALRRVLDRIAAQLHQPGDRPCDGLHEGRDYLAFPLFLTLGALGAVRGLDLLDDQRRWLDVAAAELAALGPRARATQTLFFVALLRNLGVLARQVPDPPALVRDTAASYLAATDGRRLDDYLRCAYLVHLARQLGCLAALPDRVGRILSDSRAQLDIPGPFRATPYGSPLMFVAYVVSALHAGDWGDAHDLRATDFTTIIRSMKARNDDHVTLPRLGLALIDAALCLGSPSGPDTELFAGFAM